MNGLEEFKKKEKEFEFYGFHVQDFVSEVNFSLVYVINGALENIEKKIVNKLGTRKDVDFDEVKKNYFGAVENHKVNMENLIKDAFKIPFSQDASIGEPELHESTLNQEIRDLQLRSSALDLYIKQLIKAEAYLQDVAQIDASELHQKYEQLDHSISKLSNTFHLGHELLTQASLKK